MRSLLAASLALCLLSAPSFADSIGPDLSGLPKPCTGVPAADTLNGSVGSASPCVPPADAARPTAVQAGNVTTDVSGNFTVTFARAFISASPIVHGRAVVASGAQPITCEIASRSATGAGGWCKQAAPITVSILGAVVNIFASPPSVGTPVMWVAREPTQ